MSDRLMQSDDQEEIECLRARNAELEQELSRLRGQGENAGPAAGGNAFGAILQHLPIGVGVSDHAGRFVLRNRAMEAYTAGYIPSRDEGLRDRWRASRPDGERLLPEDYPGARALRGETVLPGTEFLFIRDDGQETWTRVSAVPIEKAGPFGPGAIVVIEDINCIKRTGEELARRLDELNALYDAAPVGLCMVDRDLRYVRINRRLAEINGMPVEDHIGRTVADILPGIAETVVPALRRVIESGEAAINLDITGETAAQPDVQRSWLESWVPVCDARGRVVGVNIVAEETTERKRLLEELAKSEGRFRNLAENAPVMVRETGAEGMCTYLSRSWCEVTGQTQAEGLGLGWLGAVHPEDRPVAEAAFTEANVAQRRFRLEYRLRCHDGSYRWAIDAAAPRYGEDGTFLGYVGSVIDIDDRKRAEEALIKAQNVAQQLAAERTAILGQLSEGVIVTDREGRLTFFNEAAARLHGVERLETGPDEHSEDYHFLTVDGRPLPPEASPLALAVRNGKAVTDVRWRIARPNGTEVLVIGSAHPVDATDGSRLGAVLTMRDDTRRHAAEEALALSRRRLSAVLNNTKMGVIMMDERQHCAYMNAAAEQLTGYRFEETQGRRLHDLVHHHYPDGRPFPLHECAIDRAFPQNNQIQGEEMFIHKDGHFYPVAYTASPIRDEAAKAVGTIIEVRDIREEKKQQAHLHMLIDELNHRVKNTLATVQSIVSQALRGESVPAHVREAIESRLIALSGSHSLLTREEWSGAELGDLVREILKPFGIDHGRANRFDVGGIDVRLMPKAALALGMALHELATNAVKYGALSGEDGRISLHWRAMPGARLQLRWEECGGPPVVAPTRKGFGSRMIERGLAHELDASVKLAFARGGLTCEIDMPAPDAGRST